MRRAPPLPSFSIRPAKSIPSFSMQPAKSIPSLSARNAISIPPLCAWNAISIQPLCGESQEPHRRISCVPCPSLDDDGQREQQNEEHRERNPYHKGNQQRQGRYSEDYVRHSGNDSTRSGVGNSAGFVLLVERLGTSRIMFAAFDQLRQFFLVPFLPARRIAGLPDLKLHDLQIDPLEFGRSFPAPEHIVKIHSNRVMETPFPPAEAACGRNRALLRGAFRRRFFH